MQYLISFILISLFIFPSNTEPRDPDSNTNEDSVEYHCITAEELKLYRQINDYRKKKGLPSIPLSASLTHVAKTHAI
ncbi:MAG: hypothetical protein IIA45_07605, partial [Bacteroidetes bacterium]|nr:hypothetical protein [Bacteroidota bacterium]